MQLDMPRGVDIELTNRCNATCYFCPRDKTPKQGFMAFETFQKAIDRVVEFGKETTVFLTGLGEPTLHPRFVDCIQYMSDHGLTPAFTTNASRLTKEMSARILDGGLKKITLSISDQGEDYRDVYNLDYDVVHENVLNFLEINQGRCFVQVTIVRHAKNFDKAEGYRQYWESVPGIDYVEVIREMNRGGSLERAYFYQQSDKYHDEALHLLQKNNLTELCSLPFSSIFIGWDGAYYLCCMDWEKTVQFATIFDYSIHDVDKLKLKFLREASPLCTACSSNPINQVREAMLASESGERGKFAAANKIKSYQKGPQQHFTDAIVSSGILQETGIIASG